MRGEFSKNKGHAVVAEPRDSLCNLLCVWGEGSINFLLSSSHFELVFLSLATTRLLTNTEAEREK